MIKTLTTLKRLKKHYKAFGVLITLLTISFIGYYQANAAAEAERKRTFDTRIEDLKEAIKVQMVDYIQVLKGCQGLFYGSDTITARDWKVYIENLDIPSIYPGIQAIGYAAYIPASDKLKLEQQIKNSGFPQFKIRSSVKNSFLTPIIYIEPFNERNQRAFGYDMYDEEARQLAMDRALLSGKASITSKVTLIQDKNQNLKPGFNLYMPIYRDPLKINTPAERKRNLIGFVYYPFRSYDLLETLTGQYKDISIRIYDGSSTQEDNLLFDSESLTEGTGSQLSADPEFNGESKIHVAGRTWQILIASKDNFGSSIEKTQPLLILIFGIALSLLIFSMMYSIISRNTEMTRELQLTKELDNKKDEFIGVASHELKTPLTSIKAYMQLLERSNLQEKERNYVSKANSNIKKLNNLIGDLLDVSKIQSGQLRLNIAPFELATMVNESVENVQHMYHSHQLIIQKGIPNLTVQGDILRLEQALTNLLLNAIKYSAGSEAITINVSKINNEVRIDVCDEGIGISTDNQERIFDRYYRAKELSPVISGLGMGLYISYEILKRHHGTIEVKSELGKGSTFSILLPV